MNLATLSDGTRDGRLIVLSQDHRRYLPGPTPTLQSLLEAWDDHAPALATLADRLGHGGGDAVDTTALLAPLPRAWQWLDGSAFATHGELMERAYGLDPLPTDPPLMYQGLSHRFLAPTDDFALVSEEFGLDFEGEFGVITDAVPLGTTAQDALAHIKLVVLINDWSYRGFVQSEMKRGFGWMHAKPACSVAPVAVGPDALGDAWVHGRVCLPLDVTYNDAVFGTPNGREMGYGFHELIAYATQTRDLPAGTIIGSGTVSNADHATCGSACIAERRAIEAIAHGAPVTGFMRAGDRLRMTAHDATGRSVFGAIDQTVVSSR